MMKSYHRLRATMIIHNHTTLTEDEIMDCLLLGKIKHNWRQRHVLLFQHPDPGRLYMIGTAFDQSMKVISDEPIGMNESIAMDYWKHGRKEYVRN